MLFRRAIRFFTSSIRRKLCVGLTAISVIVLMLAASGAYGLISYGNVVKDLEFSIEAAPRKSELISAIDLLFQPLLIPPPPKGSSDAKEFALFQQREFKAALVQARVRAKDFQDKLQMMPPTPEIRGTRPIIIQFMSSMYQRLDALERHSEKLTDYTYPGREALVLLRESAALHSKVREIPDPSVSLAPRLDEAHKIYKATIRLVAFSSAMTVLLFILTTFWGYRWIFVPIQILRNGVRRILGGDHNHRIHLKTDDEMARLAEGFNNVVEKFNDTNERLDEKVREKTKELIRSERLASLGFFSAGIAHEINNPLAAIMMAAESLEYRMALCLEHFPEEDQPIVKSYLKMIQNEADRCKGITGKLLDFARGQNGKRELTDITLVVKDVLSMVSHLSKFQDRKIEFTGSDSIYAQVNGPEIKQVVLNLVANALESCDEGGLLKVAVHDRPENVEIIFIDNGIGMNADTIDRLFDPFFTQRRTGDGTGMGLSISQRIVRDHDGCIEVTSEGIGKGSIFRICLPKKMAQSLDLDIDSAA